MDIEKFTERARGFIQSAQSLALREGNQQFVPEHLLKVLMDDEEGLASRLIGSAGGKSCRRRRCSTSPTARSPRRSSAAIGSASNIRIAASTIRGSSFSTRSTPPRAAP